MTGMEKPFRPLFEHLFPPERLSAELGGPVPRAFRTAEELIINSGLHRAVKSYPVDTARVHKLLDTAGKWQIMLDRAGIGYDLKITLEKMMAVLAAAPADADILKNVLETVTLARSLPFSVDLWKVQNIYWDMRAAVYPRYKNNAVQGDPASKAWVEAFAALGKNLSIKVK